MSIADRAPDQIGPLDRDAAGAAIARLRTIHPRWARPTIIAYQADGDRVLLIVVNTHHHAAVALALHELGARPCLPVAGVIAGTRGELRGAALDAWLAGDTPEVAMKWG